MSLFGMMKTGVSGLSAQASKLGTIGDNIANADTTGYKRASVEFASLVVHNHGGEYAPGGVLQEVRYGISKQGAVEYSTSSTDLAISGKGFFLVEDGSGRAMLTRAGAFVPNGQGELVNAAGMKLLGYPANGIGDAAVINGTAGLEPVRLGAATLQAAPSRVGSLVVNLPSDAAAVTAVDLPSANSATVEYTAKASIVAYDSLGDEVLLDIYMSKVADHEWEFAVFNRADAAAVGGFPYAAAPLATDTVSFDPATGRLLGMSPTSIALAVPGGEILTIDIAETSQFATDYSVIAVAVDGNAAAPVDRIEFASDGTLYAIYQNGSRIPSYRIPLANVASPDRLNPESGTVYSVSAESGDLEIGFADSGGMGRLIAGALEASTVDIATELTSMIEAQRSFTANSKVVQTGSELLDVVVNLKR
jgi:flagellar hook protein FlgE